MAFSATAGVLVQIDVGQLGSPVAGTMGSHAVTFDPLVYVCGMTSADPECGVAIAGWELSAGWVV